MSIRKRTWLNASNISKDAWVVNYTDATGTRRLKTFQRKKEAERFDRLLNTVHGHAPEPLKRGNAPLQFLAPLPRGRRGIDRQPIVDAFKDAFPNNEPTTSSVVLHLFAEVPPAIAVADVDNLLKPVLDALSGVAYFDDTQVCECLVRRIPGKQRRLLIKMWTVPVDAMLTGAFLNDAMVKG